MKVENSNPNFWDSKQNGEETAKKIKKEAKKLKKSILSEFDISDRVGLEILERGMESYQRMREAMEIIKREGPIVYNRFQEKKEHPSLNTERKARGQFLLAMKMLNVDVIPPNHKIGRPGGS
jgi:P27 family predicted phage terminase small subunit